MEGEWLTFRLGDLVEIFDGPHATPPKAPSGPVFLGISALVDGRLDLTETEHLSEEEYARWTRRVTPRPGDVVFSYETRLGEAAIIPEGLRCCLGRRMGLLRPRSKAIDSQFLLYAYLGDEFQETVRARTIHGSTVDRIPLIEMPGFPIRIPGLDEQRAIGRILGMLDDRIQLNRRMNATLEAIVRGLFKSWFVDFEPVRAKAEGRETGLSKVVADLFPDSFEASENGPIPSAWTVRAVGDISTISGGSTPSTKEKSYWQDARHWWATPKDLSGLATPVLLDTERRLSNEGLAQVSSGLLPPGTVLMSSRAPIGYLAIAEVPVAINQGFIAMEAVPGVSNLFLLRWAESAQELIVSRANGSTFLEISKSNFRPIAVTTPTQAVMTAFDRIARPLYARVVANERTSRTLTQLRNALLPRLVSGELRIADADRISGWTP